MNSFIYYYYYYYHHHHQPHWLPSNTVVISLPCLSPTAAPCGHPKVLALSQPSVRIGRYVWSLQVITSVRGVAVGTPTGRSLQFSVLYTFSLYQYKQFLTLTTIKHLNLFIIIIIINFNLTSPVSYQLVPCCSVHIWTRHPPPSSTYQCSVQCSLVSPSAALWLTADLSATDSSDQS